MSLVSPDGKPISEGPTGRKFTLVEVVRRDASGNPVRTWGMEVVGEFEVIETFQMLGKTVDFLASRQLTELASRKAVNEVQKQMDALSKEQA